MFWGKFFGKILPTFPWRVESSKTFKKNQKLSKFQKSQIIYQKCPNVFWTCFGANFSKKNICPVFNGGSRLLNLEKSWKSLKNPIMPKIVPKSVQMCFEHVLGQFFWKVSWPVFHGGSRLRKFSKKTLKMSNFQKCSKLFAKVSRSVLGWFFRKNFIHSVAWRAEFSKIFEKKIYSKIQKGRKLFPKVSKRVLNMFWGKLFGKILPSFPWSVESSKIFKKKKT